MFIVLHLTGTRNGLGKRSQNVNDSRECHLYGIPFLQGDVVFGEIEKSGAIMMV